MVDDDELVRRALVRCLTRRGYAVQDARDPFDATLICARTKVDLLVTDIVMPGLSGFELARRLMPAHPAMKVLFISGGDRYDGDHVLAKPFSISTFETAVRTLLRA